MDSRRFNKLVEKVRSVRNHKVIYDRIGYSELEEQQQIVSALREKLTINYAQLANLIGVQADDVYEWEHGFSDPSCAEKIVLWIALHYPDIFFEAANRIKPDK